MLTFEKVMEVFQDYLAEDTRYEIIMTSHGYTVLEWDSRANTWAGEELCATPEIMRDVLLDIMMPKMDGYAVCEMIRNESDTPVILLMALDDEDSQMKGFDLLAAD